MPPETKIGVFPWQSSDLFEAINTARALRRFKPDPVPDEVLSKILEAGIRAPSGSNEQTWLFVVVKDPEQRHKLGEVYRKGGVDGPYADRVKPEHMDQKQYDKLTASATYLIDHMADAPVLLLACLQPGQVGAPPAKLPRRWRQRCATWQGWGVRASIRRCRI